jgi:hypothetical protein
MQPGLELKSTVDSRLLIGSTFGNLSRLLLFAFLYGDPGRTLSVN